MGTHLLKSACLFYAAKEHIEGGVEKELLIYLPTHFCQQNGEPFHPMYRPHTCMYTVRRYLFLNTYILQVCRCNHYSGHWEKWVWKQTVIFFQDKVCANCKDDICTSRYHSRYHSCTFNCTKNWAERHIHNLNAFVWKIYAYKLSHLTNAHERGFFRYTVGLAGCMSNDIYSLIEKCLQQKKSKF